MAKIVVFGGSGFLGSHVADELTSRDHEVVIFDSLNSPYLKPTQSMVLGDLESYDDVLSATTGADAVFNFAAIADITVASQNPLRSCRVNVLGNLNVLEACRVAAVQKFVLASSVYVNSSEGQFYKCSKIAAENYTKEYQKLYGLQCTILRYGSLYGPRADKNNGVRKIIEAAINEQNIRYRGDRDAVRQYIHVRDAAFSTAECLKNKYENQTFVISGHETIRVEDFLKLVAEILGKPLDTIEFENTLIDGHYIKTPFSYEPELSKKIFPEAQTELAEGILQLIKQMDKQETHY